MSTSTNESKPQSNNGFGGKLRSARTSRGYSLDAVAKELNILKRYVQALEEENFSALPPFAYARGFIINYAKFLELDSNEFANAFDGAYPDDMRPKTTSSPLTPMGTLHRGRASVRINPWLIGGVIGLVVLGIVLLKIISNATGKSDETSLERSLATQDAMTLAEQAQGAAIGGSGSAIGTAVIATPESEPVPAGQGVVDIWSKGDVHIKITDKNDNVLMQGLQAQGGYQVKGETPLNVEIDNPAQVDVKFNNDPVRLGEHTQNGKATLTLQ
ncbi:MAG: DUF4115 domain-containing protein [Moraxella sp.]|nr:DUF4115 domain-containing protein [Moraxella sp.]